MILNNEGALWHYKRQLETLPPRIAQRKSEGLPTGLQELDLAAAEFAIAALEFTIASIEYEQSHKEI